MGKNIAIVFSIIILFLGCNKDKYDLTHSFLIKCVTLVLTNNESNALTYLPIKILNVYSYDSLGKKIFFESNLDYRIEGNRIWRTTNSKIPNYSKHRVTYNNDNKFIWNAEPNRNPELNIPYFVCVDYITNDDGELIRIPEKKSLINCLIS